MSIILWSIVAQNAGSVAQGKNFLTFHKQDQGMRTAENRLDTTAFLLFVLLLAGWMLVQTATAPGAHRAAENCGTKIESGLCFVIFVAVTSS